MAKNHNSIDRPGAFARVMQIATKIEPHELKAVTVSFIYVFSLMCGYYILRPIRDSLASEFSDAELSTLYTATFFMMLIVVPAYGYACTKIKLSRLLPWVYGFFSLNILAFFLFVQIVPDSQWLGRVFYVWASVFNLFVISVFWSFMADMYTKEQARRIFGFIAAGASGGAIAGPAITVYLADQVGSFNLLPISAVLIAVPIIFIRMLIKIRANDPAAHANRAIQNLEQPMGGNPFAGFALFFKSPYLLGIGLFIIIYTFMNTVVYFQLKNMMIDVDPDTRTQIWAGIDLAVNILAAATQLFATSRLATRFGLVTSLAIIPVLMIGGFMVLALVPLLSVVIGLQIARRAGNYAITRPCREMLFTIVDPESKYKAKNVIDTVVYRGGDMTSAWMITGLSQGLGYGFAGIAAVAAAAAALWSLVAVSLGRSYDRRNAADDELAATMSKASEPAE